MISINHYLVHNCFAFLSSLRVKNCLVSPCYGSRHCCLLAVLH